MQKELESIHPLIGFSHVIPKKPEVLTNIDTRYGPVVVGSPLSFHLSSLEFNFTVVTNLEPAVNPAQADSSDIYKVSLPFHFPDLPEAVHFSTVRKCCSHTLVYSVTTNPSLFSSLLIAKSHRFLLFALRGKEKNEILLFSPDCYKKNFCNQGHNNICYGHRAKK